MVHTSCSVYGCTSTTRHNKDLRFHRFPRDAIGVVDFGMLQTVLHCLAQQLRILGKNVQLRGSMAALPSIRGENAQTINISEFVVDTQEPGKYNLATGPPSPDQESLLVVERVKRAEVSAQAAPAPTGVLTPQRPGPQKSRPSKAASAGQPSKVSSAAPQQPSQPSKVFSAGPQQMSPPSAAPLQPSTQPSQVVSSEPQQAGQPSQVLSAPTQQTSQVSQPPPASQRPSVEKLSLVTLSKFNLLESTVTEIKNRVFGTSPKNEEILQEVRSQGNMKAITDMWTNMNVASRLDAAEAGIGKLSSLIEDLIGETVELQKTVGAAPSPAAARMAEEANALSKVPPPPPAPAPPAPPRPAPASTAASAPVTPAASATRPDATSGHEMRSTSVAPSQMQARPKEEDSAHFFDANAATKDELNDVMRNLQRLRSDVEELTRAFNNAMKEVDPSFVPAPLPSAPEMTPPGDEGATAVGVAGGGKDRDSEALKVLEGRLMEKINIVEKDLKRCCDSLKKSDGLVHDQMTSLQDQLEYMTKQIADMSANSALGSGELSPGLIKDLQGLMKLFETVQNMQTELQHVHQTALELAAEKDDRQHHIDALLEQIELLKIIKLDREDMVEALADKADLRMLARKVSHDQFESACDDLSKGLEHALGKLNVQESLWQQALDDIQREIEQKLNKMELSPVKDFFNKKLKQLQDNLKQMAELRREAEAAGTKRRLLRDVNCISCDAKAVMKMDAASPMPRKPLQTNMSMKPYLTYELDAIRKTQASNLPQRNLHDWENVQQQMAPKPQKVRSETDKHLCNRYCGGSHTVTTPAQRVARLGHFIKQWGPEVLPLSSGYAAGDDGRLYKTSTVEGAGVGPGGAVENASVCTPKASKKPDNYKDGMPGITLECRCLDPQEKQPKN